MELKPVHCPSCRSTTVGTLDNVPGIALVSGRAPDGRIEYFGLTHMFWEGQESRYAGRGKKRSVLMACCDCGHKFWKKCPERNIRPADKEKA